MTLDDLKELGIVVGHIADAELGNKFIACVGKETPGGIKSLDGQHWMGDSPLQAAMRCYEDSNVRK
ncbi:hypothetical protein [Paraburkholderia kirstenboschensis]|uniref:Uncharacterized protein n=1 Tax=Paraburkholderia kirstenboschensis TaxID=1245436 RepID=A0ABZ0EA77_9BURK|nr:hypothetical protein [Paraburkholderia kirstenboschensis]WOD14156.1 hypothetical protein RW095_01125 [Paraburkholderia kirstenboschensis]